MPERCKAWKTMKPFPALHTAPWKTPMLPAVSHIPPALDGYVHVYIRIKT